MGISSNSIRTDAISMMMVQDVGAAVGSMSLYGLSLGQSLCPLLTNLINTT